MENSTEKELVKEMTLENMSAQKKSAEMEQFQYKRDDCEKGFITNPLEIEDYIRNQKIDIYQNALLGDYDSSGEYYLIDEIRDELLKAPKIVTNNYENYIFLQSMLPLGSFGTAKFFVTVSKLDEGLIATLTFVEPIHKMNKLVTNAQSVLIGSYADKGGESFYYKMKNEFHIVDDDFVVPDDEKDGFKYSIRRKMQRRSVWKESVQEMERTEKRIFEKKMEVLKKAKNDFSKEVLKKFDEQVKNKSPYFKDKENEFICLNQLMDTCINATLGQFPKEQESVLADMLEAISEIGKEQVAIIDKAKVITTNKTEQSKETKTIPKEKDEPHKDTPTHKTDAHSQKLTGFIGNNVGGDLKNLWNKAKGVGPKAKDAGNLQSITSMASLDDMEK